MNDEQIRTTLDRMCRWNSISVSQARIAFKVAGKIWVHAVCTPIDMVDSSEGGINLIYRKTRGAIAVSIGCNFRIIFNADVVAILNDGSFIDGTLLELDGEFTEVAKKVFFG